MKIFTEKAFLIDQKSDEIKNIRNLEPLSGDWVAHIFTRSGDSRRYTQYYRCVNAIAASNLIDALMVN